MITTEFRIDKARLSQLCQCKFAEEIESAYQQLITGKGAGGNFLGWLDLPETVAPQIKRINEVAATLSRQSEVLVVTGIGGSYLGVRAIIEALQTPFNGILCGSWRTNPVVLYAGNNLSESYLHDLLQVLDQKDYSLFVISKSGTTLEPSIAFSILRAHCEQKYGIEKAAERIIAVTDEKKGLLRNMAVQKNYTTFAIPENVGGRYSVLTPVGLLPVAAAGVDINKIIAGAQAMRNYILASNQLQQNIAMQYALCRYLLYKENKKIELMVSFEPALFYFIEWYKQLFGESEGKAHKGIFPTGAIFSTDLHSLGQYIQEGERHLFETIISVKEPARRLSISKGLLNRDGLNNVKNRSLHDVNKIAEQASCMAHQEGGIPIHVIQAPSLCENSLGELIFFFEFSCALGGYLLHINPFDQPGVEAYKKNIFQLLKE